MQSPVVFRYTALKLIVTTFGNYYDFIVFPSL